MSTNVARRGGKVKGKVWHKSLPESKKRPLGAFWWPCMGKNGKMAQERKKKDMEVPLKVQSKSNDNQSKSNQASELAGARQSVF